jgi:2-polyprenyl-6-methoxyphenol hydroxylase-like FAD-dependent oxidoreductase
MDVLWFHVRRDASDSEDTVGRFERGSVFVAINRQSYWQCGFVIPKGTFGQVQADGLDAFRSRVAELGPFGGDAKRTLDIKSWDDVKLLTVTVDRLERWWKPGLLLIGDAAHAMSPIGGVGVNLAVQDAVAAARILAGPLKVGEVNPADLAAVQSRRLWPVRVTQALQVQAQNRVVKSALSGGKDLRAPWAVKALTENRLFRGLVGRLIGLGIRPEHVAVNR